MEQLYAAAVASAEGVIDQEIRSGTALPLQPAVRQAIASMHERYFNAITLTELAAEVYVSPFHFSRIFAKATGVTPGRYLTAIRLFEAKRLLLTTTLTVSDIVCSVGYSSVGTFTSRFTRAVGMTPSQYRDPEVGQLLVALAPHYRRLPSAALLRGSGKSCSPARPGSGSIDARIEMPPGAPPADVFVGVFAEAIPQCGPIAFSGRSHTGSTDLTIPRVPVGNWTVIALAEHAADTGAATFSVATVRHPVEVRPGRPGQVRLRMRAPMPTDPPIAITLASPPTSLAGRMVASERPHLRAVA